MTDEGVKLNIKPDALTYAEAARCRCGAGLAYAAHLLRDADPSEPHSSSWRAWWCSAVLKGEVAVVPYPEHAPRPTLLEGSCYDTEGKQHTILPFAFYEVRSEKQPRAGTTRPDHEPRAKSYDEERSEAVAALPEFVDAIDLVFDQGLQASQCDGLAHRIERKPWGDVVEVAREIRSALCEALRHEPPPLDLCAMLWRALAYAVRHVQPTRCAGCKGELNNKGHVVYAHRKRWHPKTCEPAR